MFYQTRKRTRLEDIVYVIHLYFLGLSLRNTSKALSRFVNRSNTAIRDWIQRYQPEEILSKRKKIVEYIVDEYHFIYVPKLSSVNSSSYLDQTFWF